MCDRFILFGRAWNYGYEPFRLAGTDTLMTVSPTHNAIVTCDPEVASQILQSAEFGKPPDLIELLNVFGPGLTGSDGARGRFYRKTTAPFFTTQIMELVWKTSMDSVQDVMPKLAEVLGTETNESRESLRSVVAKMTLHNVVSICFGQDPDGEIFRLQESIPAGHKIGFRKTMTSILDCIAIIAFTPKLILSISMFVFDTMHKLNDVRDFPSPSSQGHSVPSFRATCISLRPPAKCP